jgi:uncharacterized membrane protein YdfJ with MMPL/SSD domain
MAMEHTARAVTPPGRERGWTRWAGAVIRLRWVLLAVAVVLIGVGAAWGGGVFDKLSSGGFDDPGSQSARAARRIEADLGGRTPDVIVLLSSDRVSVDDAAFRTPVTATVAAWRQRAEVARVVTAYDTPAPSLVSRDRHETYAVLTLQGRTDDAKRAGYRALRGALQVPGLTTRVGGVVAMATQADDTTKADVTRGESLAMPAVLILLLLIFGGVVAASLPLLIGALAVLVALTITRLITTVTDVSTFAANTITLLGLGMAVDYSLFVVSRFREELRAGHPTRAAIGRTLATAGRTVLVSGITVVLALSSLLVFPEGFLRSMGIGGISAVAVAMLASLTVLPAILAILGRRVDALRMPWRRRRRTTAPAAPSTTQPTNGWRRLAQLVMRHPARYLVIVAGLLAVLALPFGHARFAGADERILPPGDAIRVVSDHLRTDFPGATTAPIQVVLHGTTPGGTGAAAFADRIAALPGVIGVHPVASNAGTALLEVGYPGEPTSHRAYQAVRDIRALPAPPGTEVLVGGQPARDVDLLASLRARLPWMAAIMATITLIVLFLAFGSILLPIKAVLANLLSLSASFGVMVWAFQDGHLAGPLHFTATGFIEPNVPIFLLAVLFGLATDYEVFLLSRVREAWDANGDHRFAVARGLHRTGGIITAAALLLIVVVAGFTTGSIVFTKLIGVGMVTAIVIDATLVRILLVPAAMRLLGARGWWAPGPLARLYRRIGIHETATAGAPETTAVPAPVLAATPAAGRG